jgi:hypothetical protein
VQQPATFRPRGLNWHAQTFLVGCFLLALAPETRNSNHQAERAPLQPPFVIMMPEYFTVEFAERDCGKGAEFHLSAVKV